MYSNIKLALKYIQYYITADNGKGHGVHSPFVFSFIRDVLQNNQYPTYIQQIESARNHLLQDDTVINVWDGGAGSRISKTNTRKISTIAKNALKSPKYAKLLHDIVLHFKPYTIIELGTSLGISTAYMAMAHPSNMITLEGAASVAAIAKKQFEKLALNNIQLVEGNFDQTLPSIIKQMESWDITFIDGNHMYEPTLRYFETLLSCANNDSIFILDDIHWSKEMEEAWNVIKKHPRVTLTIDLFFIGLVFIREENKIPMHYTIRY